MRLCLLRDETTTSLISSHLSNTIRFTLPSVDELSADDLKNWFLRYFGKRATHLVRLSYAKEI